MSGQKLFVDGFVRERSDIDGRLWMTHRKCNERLLKFVTAKKIAVSNLKVRVVCPVARAHLESELLKACKNLGRTIRKAPSRRRESNPAACTLDEPRAEFALERGNRLRDR